MVRYRRNFVEGGTYFITVTLADRRSSLLVQHIDAFRTTLRKVKHDWPFRLDACVVLPDHWHVVMTLPVDDMQYGHRVRLIKAGFARGIRDRGVAVRQNSKGEYLLWQRRFWEHTIRDDDDLQRHVDYIHINAVKHGLCERAVDWPYSTIHRYIRLGWLGDDWAHEPPAGKYGE